VGPNVREGNVNFGRSSDEQNFGTRFTGLSWVNSQRATNVDGVNGVTPLDALLAINELDARTFSDPQTGQLVVLTEPLNEARFLDVNNDGLLSPLDALLVINDLPTKSPLSATAGADPRSGSRALGGWANPMREFAASPRSTDRALELMWDEI
jgi:hypothetical protein